MSQIQDFDVDQGADFSLGFEIEDVPDHAMDLAGVTLRGQVREKASDASSVASFGFTVASPTTLGKFTATLTAAASSALKMAKSAQAERKITEFAYDIEMVRVDSVVIRLLSGVLRVSPEVTR